MHIIFLYCECENFQELFYYFVAAGRTKAPAPDADEEWNERAAVPDGGAEERDRFTAAGLWLFDLLPGQVCGIGKKQFDCGKKYGLTMVMQTFNFHAQEMEHQQELQRMRSDIEALSTQLVDSKETVSLCLSDNYDENAVESWVLSF